MPAGIADARPKAVACLMKSRRPMRPSLRRLRSVSNSCILRSSSFHVFCDAFTRRPCGQAYHGSVAGAPSKSPGADHSVLPMVGALKDAWSGNLDRNQIIKGWVDEQGERHDRVYDVEVSDGRKIDSDGRCRTPVGTTVDEANATYLNNIGDARTRTGHWPRPRGTPACRSESRRINAKTTNCDRVCRVRLPIYLLDCMDRGHR